MEPSGCEGAFGNTMGQATNEATRVKENNARSTPLDKGKEKDTRINPFETKLSNGRDNDPDTSGENGADELDHSASTSVYTGHLIIPRMWKRIAPEKKALARMRKECGHDPELANEVMKCMGRYYEGIDSAPEATFSKSLRVQELRRQLETNYHAKRKGRPMPFPMPQAEFLAQRYCHPRGVVDGVVASWLARLGKSRLSRVNAAQKNRVVNSTSSHPEIEVKANQKTESASRIAALGANQAALEANRKALAEHRSQIEALEAERKLLEANRKVLEAPPRLVADNATHATQREIPQNVATNNIPGITHQLEAVQEVTTDNTAPVMEPQSAATKASDVIVTKSFLARVLERVIDGELAEERAKLANEIKSTVEKELAELRARIVQLENAHQANPSGSASRPRSGQVAHTPQDLSIFGAKSTLSAPAYPEVMDSIEIPHISFLDSPGRRRRLVRQGGDDEDGRPVKRLARLDSHTDSNDEADEPLVKLVELDTRVTPAGSAIKKEDRFE